MSNVFTYSQVAEHNTSDSAWIIINNNVYDITQFLDTHPGGDEIILEMTGNDATQDFQDIGHSNDALGFLKAMKIGSVDTSSPRVKMTAPQKLTKRVKRRNGRQGNGTIVLVAAVAFFTAAIYLSS